MIRLARLKDVKSLIELRLDQQKEEWGIIHNYDSEIYLRTEYYLKNNLNKEMFLYVYIEADKIVGACCVQLLKSIRATDDVNGQITNIYTMKKYKNQNIEEELLKYCIKNHKKININNLSLSNTNRNVIKHYYNIHKEVIESGLTFSSI